MAKSFILSRRKIGFDRMERVEMKKSVPIAHPETSRKRAKSPGDSAINATGARESFGAKSSLNGSEQCFGENILTSVPRYRSYLLGIIVQSTGYAKNSALLNFTTKDQKFALPSL